MNTDFIEWEVQVVKYRPPGGDMWGRLLSVGTSPYGRGTYGYAHSPLRGVCPPGTEKGGNGTRQEKAPGYEEMGMETDEHRLFGRISGRGRRF